MRWPQHWLDWHTDSVSMVTPKGKEKKRGDICGIGLICAPCDVMSTDCGWVFKLSALQFVRVHWCCMSSLDTMPLTIIIIIIIIIIMTFCLVSTVVRCIVRVCPFPSLYSSLLIFLRLPSFFPSLPSLPFPLLFSLSPLPSLLPSLPLEVGPLYSS